MTFAPASSILPAATSIPATPLLCSPIQRLLLVTDAWLPQVNGVVTTLEQLVRQLQLQGVEVEVIHPQPYPTWPLPTYPEIRLVWRAPDLEARIRRFAPHAIHIATEGTLGWKARALALKHGWPFTTAYHTKYPEYIRQRFGLIPERWIYGLMRKFHQPAQTTFVPAASIRQELKSHGFDSVEIMTRGIDPHIFRRYTIAELNAQPVFLPTWPKPWLLYVGRVAPEKNLPAFLELKVPGTKIVIGSGPDLPKLQTLYPQVQFLGKKSGAELARAYASADVFVFPSKTDTFGVVNIEAMACGTPVAAYDVTGPKDSVQSGYNGCLSSDLGTAIQGALRLRHRDAIAQSVRAFNWQQASIDFQHHLAKLPSTDWQTDLASVL
ncbi:MAG: glycosyltransferase family 1 protein [Thiotrichales bacterium]|nr:glycosyltransferase family 1 protein [Thiotrichales bacterium]